VNVKNFGKSWATFRKTIGFAGQTRRRKRNVLQRRPGFEGLEERRVLATLTVTTPVDELTTNSVVSVREAIRDAASGDTIDFDLTTMNGAVISLTLFELEIIGKSLTIDASMLPNGITIDANDFDRGSGNEARGNGNRIFEIIDTSFQNSAPPEVTLKSLKLTGGDILSTPSDDKGGQGGAIRSEGLLTLENCTIFGNYASTGGGIFVNVKGHESSRQVLTITDSLLGDALDAAKGNTATQDGGAIAVRLSGETN
jgi:hypothetical protein